MHWLVDAHLPYRLAELLRQLGDEVTHTLQLPHGNASTDLELIAYATAHNAVVISKDADFVNFFHLHNRPRLLLVSTGNISNDALLTLFKLHHSHLLKELEHFDFVELSSKQIICHA